MTTTTYTEEQAPIVAAQLVPALRNASAIVKRLGEAGVLVLGINFSSSIGEQAVAVHASGRTMDEALMVRLTAAVGLSERVDPTFDTFTANTRGYERETWRFGDVEVFYQRRVPALDVMLTPDCESGA